MTRRRLRPFTAVAFVAALALAGCGSGTDDTPEPTDPVVESPAETAPGDDATPGEEATGPDDGATATDEVALAAIATAEAAVPGSTAIAYDRDGRDRYIDIDVALGDAEHEVYVDITGTQVIRQQRSDTLDAEDLAEIAAATVPMADAITAALAVRPGVVDDVDLDTRRGSVRWEIEIRDGVRNPEILVDAATGDVLS